MCKHLDMSFDYFAMNMRDVLCKMEEERSGVSCFTPDINIGKTIEINEKANEDEGENNKESSCPPETGGEKASENEQGVCKEDKDLPF